jgi:hypothetical protein
MLSNKQMNVSMAALNKYQPKGQDVRYPFGADALIKLDEFITLKLTSPDYDPLIEIDLIGLDIFVYKYFVNFGWFFGIISRFWKLKGVGYVQVNHNK